VKTGIRCQCKLSRRSPLIKLAQALVLVAILTACGGTGNSSLPPPASTIQLNPPSVILDETTQVQFTATGNGTNLPSVTWSIQEGAAGGSITSQGLYVPPHQAGIFHVIATAKSNPAQKAIAPVTVEPVLIAIDPVTDVVLSGGVVQYVAEVSGTSGYGLVLSVQEGASGGSITATGVYTAPTTTGTYHIVATSAFDSSQFATATVTVVNSGRFFQQTGSMSYSRTGHTATLVSTGVLITGGGYCVEDPGNGCFFVPIATGELFDEAGGAFNLTGDLATRRQSHTATQLVDGSVLVTGGYDGADATPTAELYNPATGVFTQTGDMAIARSEHAATLLNSGKVLVTGGLSRYPATPLQSAELYLATGQFSAAGSLHLARYGHTATLLPSGKVLVAGGFAPDGQGGISPTNSAELYDPATNAFISTHNMGGARAYHAAVLLGNGKVLIVGGYAGDGQISVQTPPTAELYDPSTGSFGPTGDMAIGGEGLTATLLMNGEVLVAGGQNGFLGYLRTVELYDPLSGTFAPTASLSTPRAFHTATLLPDGKVLVTGGSNQTAEIY